jgi:hypothetical protein
VNASAIYSSDVRNCGADIAAGAVY